MTFVATNLWLPGMDGYGGGGAMAFSPQTLDAASDRVGAIFVAPKTGNIRKVRLRFGTVTKDATTTIRVSFQDVDATTGFPDETDDAYRVILNGSIVANTTVQTDIMSSDGTDGGALKAVTKGLRYAIVVKYETFVAADAVQIQGYGIATRAAPWHFEYRVDNLTGTYAKQFVIVAAFTLEYDDGTVAFCPGMLPVEVPATTSYNINSTPDEIGLLFSLPFPFKLKGAWLGSDADGDFDLVWYDGASGTRVASVDKDVRLTTTSMVGAVLFESEITGAANTTYVLSVKPTSATSMVLHYFDVAAVLDFDQLAVGQGNFTYVTAKDPTTKANFTETTTRRPSMGVLISAVDDGAGDVGSGLVAVQPFIVPSYHNHLAANGGFTFSSILLDAASDRVAFILRMPKTGTLAKVGFLLGTVTQGNTLKVSFQNVDTTTGFPDTTVDQFRTVAVSDTDDNLWKETGLITSDGTDGGAKRSVTIDDSVAIVFEFDSFVASDSLSIQTLIRDTRLTFISSVHVASNTTGSYAKAASNSPLVYLEYDDGSTYFLAGTWPYTTKEATSFHSGSNPDERALKFKMPFPCKVLGAWAHISAANGGDSQLVLYGADGSTVLGSSSFDEDNAGSANSAVIGYFTQGQQILAKDTFYYLSLKPTTGSTVSMNVFVVDSAKIFDAWEFGQNWHLATRVDAGSWTADTLRRPAMGLIISALDDGAGAGGGIPKLAGRGGLAG